MSSIDDIKHKDVPAPTDPKTALARLKDGNQSYQQGNYKTDTLDGRDKRVDSQYPFAAILSCADSRVVPELNV